MNDSAELTGDLAAWAAGLEPRSPWQRTLLRPSAWLRGREPQSGHSVSVRFFPAPPGTGLVYSTDRSFARRARDGEARPNPRQTFAANIDDACSVDVCIGVGLRRAAFADVMARPAIWITHIEHLNAAFYAMGVDNAYVLVAKETYARDLSDKRAVPILASCTLGFVRAIAAAGLVEQEGARRVCRTLRAPFEDCDPVRGDVIRALPADSPDAPITVHYRAGYPSLGVEDCELEIELTPTVFLHEVAAARTMLGQLNHLPIAVGRLLGLFAFASYGFGLGVNPANTMAPIRGTVVGEPRYGSPGQELVRHKVVDFLGAVALLGPLSGIRFEVQKSGHANDLRVLRRIAEQLEPVTNC